MKKQKKRTESVNNKIYEDLKTTQEIIEEVMDIPEVEVSEKVWFLHDAARQMIKNYKETWWPSIHKMASHYAIKDEATDSQCRELFLKWGAELK